MAQQDRLEVLLQLDSLRDPTLHKHDPNQPQEFQELRNFYIQNFSATPQGPGTPALSYGQNTWGAVQEGGRQIGEDVSDMVTGVADFFGADEWAEEKRRERAVYDKISQEYGGWAREGYDPNRAVIDLPGEGADIRARHLESAVRSAPATLAAVGGGVLTGGLLPAAGALGAGAGTAARLGGMALSAAPTVGGMTAMSGVVYPQFFEQALREGLDRSRAAEQAFVYTLAEVVGEALPIGKILSRTPGARSFAREILGGIAAETAGEYVTEFGQMAYDMARKGEDVTSDEFWSRMNDVWKVSVIMAGGTQAPVASAKAIADRLIEADPEYINQLMMSEGARLGYDPKAVVSDPMLESKSGYETEGAVGIGTKKMTFNPNLIKDMARDKAGKGAQLDSEGRIIKEAGKVTRQDAKNRVNQLLMHEGATHGGLFSFFATGKGGDVKSFNEYLEKFYEQNKAEVDAWLETDERGLAYPTGKGDAYDTPVNRVNEYVAIQLGEGTKTGLVRGIISKAKLLLKKNTGFDYSPAEVQDLIRSAHMSMQAGTLSPEVAAEGEGTSLESRTGEPADPSRRKFMKQVGGAAAGAALDPSILLEPATTPAVEASMYGGMTEQFPGSVYEFSIATDPNAGWTSSDDPSEGAMDVAFTHDPNTNEVTVYEGDSVVDTFEVDDMHADGEVLDYVRDKYGPEHINDVRVQREEMDRDPETGEGAADYWGDADQRFDDMAASLIRGEKTMAGVERVERGPAYDYLDEPETPRLPEQKAPAIEKPTQKALPAPEETTEKTDSEQYVETIDEIMSIYDDDATAAEAAEDGTLNDRIISYAAETPFTRSELWEGVNERIESLEESTTPRLESRVRKPKTETVQRDINDTARKTRTKITDLDIEDSDKDARHTMLKRLGKVMGNPARKRGVDAGNQDVFDQHAKNVLDGNLEEVETFIAPFEEQMGGRQERDFKAEARRDQRAKLLGKTDAEILKYRAKGDKHPMEGKMTYPFAQEEINRQEEAGEITAEEAEIRRLAVNNVRRIFKGKAGPTVKRTITEAVYGIGAYEDLVPWSEVYTEEQSEEMGERAEVAEAEARRTRYDPTDITEKQKQDLLKDPVIAEEAAWIASEEMSSIKGSEERLLFLRAPAEFKSKAEQKEFESWRRNQRDFDAAEYKKRERLERDKTVEVAEKEGKVTVVPPVDTEKLQKESRRTLEQVDPSVFDTMVTQYGTDYANALERAGFNYDREGNLIDEAEGEVTSGAEVVDNAKLESRTVISETDLVMKLEDVATLEDFTEFVKQPLKLATSDEALSYIEDNVDIDDWAKWEEVLNDAVSKQKYEEATLLDNLSNRERDKENRDKMLKKSTPEEQDRRKLLAKVVTELNKVFGGGRFELEHMFNITAREIIAGEARGQRLHAELIEGERSVNTIDNLIILPKIIHEIKTRFERSHASGGSGIAYQSAQPYIDLIKISKDPALADKYGITEADGKIVEDYRNALRKEFGKMQKNKHFGFTSLVRAYQAAFKTIGESMDINDTALQQARPGEHDVTIAAIKDMVDVGLNKDFENRLQRGVDEVTDGAISGPVLFSRVDAKRIKDKGATYSEHFNDSFWYRATSFLWGKPVQAIRDFNKTGRFGTERADIEAADKIADLFQRHQSAKMRAEGMETGTDFVQDVSLRTGEFYSKLSKIFAEATDRLGVLTEVPNGELVDFLAGKDVKFSDPAVKKAAEQLRDLMDGIYKYAKEETKGLESPLNLKGEGDSLLPRVWNIEYLATRQGKAKLLKTLSDRFSEREGGKPIFEDADITVEDMYDIIINSGGFVQGDWTNLKADQTRSEKDIERDLKIQEYLDMLDTETLIDGDLVLDDLQAVIPRFIQKAVERTEYAKRFGTNDEILRGLIGEGIDQIREHNREVLKLKKDAKLSHIDEKRFAKAAWDMARIARNKYGYDMANMPTRKWIQRLTNAATIMKLPLVALASMPEFFTPMLKGDISPHHWFVDLMAATTWAGYKGMNGISKLLLNQHLPAMRKMSRELGGSGILSDIQLLREMGIADIQAMGDLVSTRYANPNFARGGLRAGGGGSIAGKIPKHVRGVFNMQTFMQATMLTTMTEMQQLMALRNYQRHVSKRIDFVQGNKGKTLSGRKARIFKQYTQDLLDYGITGDIDLKTSSGEAAFNAGALRFIDQVITRPNDATTAKAFKNPLISPLVLFKRFITTFGNTLLTSVGNDFAHSVDNVERAKVVGKVGATAMAMYGAVMFSEIIRGAIKGDLDEDDFKAIPGDFNQFVRRLDRTGLLSAPGTMAVNLAFPYKRGWWDSTEARIVSEALGPLGGDLTTFGDTLLDPKKNGWKRLLGQLIPTTKPFMSGKSDERGDRRADRAKRREQRLKRRKERREARG